jgi:O-antigen/teichoic acid export membrane protein
MRDTLTILSGTAVSQTFPLLAAPLLTRLYCPEAFGSFSSFIAAATILGVIATGRYELAVVMPRSTRRAVQVMVGAMALATTVSFLVGAISILGLVVQGTSSVWTRWPLGLAPMVWLLAISAVFVNVLNRERKFGLMATQQVGQKCSAEASKVVLGAVGIENTGLILGALAGQAVALCLMLRAVLKTAASSLRGLRSRMVCRSLKRYWKLPVFTATYSLTATCANEFLVIVFASAGQLAVAGLIGLTRRMLVAPVTFLSSALGQVYFKETCEHIYTSRLESLTVSLVWRIGALAAPAFTFLVYWGAPLFELMFGREWAGAGTYASILSLPCYMFFFTSWPERIYEVTGRQHLSFAIQFVTDLIKVGLTYMTLRSGRPPVDCVIVFAAVSMLFHVLYLGGLMRVARFSALGAFRIILGITVPVLIALLIFAPAHFLSAGPGRSFSWGLALLLASYALVLGIGGRRIFRLR